MENKINKKTVELAVQNSNQNLFTQYNNYITLFDKIDKEFEKNKEELDEKQDQDKLIILLKQVNPLQRYNLKRDEIYNQCLKQIVQDLNLLNLDIFGVIIKRMMLAIKNEKNNCLKIQTNQFRKSFQNQQQKQNKPKKKQGSSQVEEQQLHRINNLQLIVNCQNDELKQTKLQLTQTQTVIENLNEQNLQLDNINQSLIQNLSYLEKQKNSETIIVNEHMNTTDTFAKTLTSLQQIHQLREQKNCIDKVNSQNLQSMQEKIKVNNNNEYEQMVYDQFDRKIIMSDNINTYEMQMRFQDLSFNHQKLSGFLEQCRYEINSIYSVLKNQKNRKEINDDDEEQTQEEQEDSYRTQISKLQTMIDEIQVKVKSISHNQKQSHIITEQVEEKMTSITGEFNKYQMTIKEYQNQFQVLDINNQKQKIENGMLKEQKYKEQIKSMDQSEQIDKLKTDYAKLKNQLKNVMREKPDLQQQSLQQQPQLDKSTMNDTTMKRNTQESIIKQKGHHQQSQSQSQFQTQISALELQLQSQQNLIERQKQDIMNMLNQQEEKDNRIQDLQNAAFYHTTGGGTNTKRKHKHGIEKDVFGKKESSQFIKNLMVKYNVQQQYQHQQQKQQKQKQHQQPQQQQSCQKDKKNININITSNDHYNININPKDFSNDQSLSSFQEFVSLNKLQTSSTLLKLSKYFSNSTSLNAKEWQSFISWLENQNQNNFNTSYQETSKSQKFKQMLINDHKHQLRNQMLFSEQETPQEFNKLVNQSSQSSFERSRSTQQIQPNNINSGHHFDINDDHKIQIIDNNIYNNKQQNKNNEILMNTNQKNRYDQQRASVNNIQTSEQYQQRSNSQQLIFRDQQLESLNIPEIKSSFKTPLQFKSSRKESPRVNTQSNTKINKTQKLQQQQNMHHMAKNTDSNKKLKAIQNNAIQETKNNNPFNNYQELYSKLVDFLQKVKQNPNYNQLEKEINSQSLSSFFELKQDELSLLNYDQFQEKVKECSVQQLHHLRALLSQVNNSPQQQILMTQQILLKLPSIKK